MEEWCGCNHCKKHAGNKRTPIATRCKTCCNPVMHIIKGIASDFSVVWLLVQAKTKVDIALQ